MCEQNLDLVQEETPLSPTGGLNTFFRRPRWHYVLKNFSGEFFFNNYKSSVTLVIEQINYLLSTNSIKSANFLFTLAYLYLLFIGFSVS